MIFKRYNKNKIKIILDVKANAYIEYLVFSAAVALASMAFLGSLGDYGSVKFQVESAYDSLQAKILNQ